MFLHEGYRVLTPDSRAHGASEGRFVTYGLLEKYDAIAWADWMRSVGCQKVYALGESLGASILIEAAGVRPAFSAIVAEAPYASLREIAEYRVQRLAGMPNLVAKATVNTAAFYARHIDHLDLMQVSPVKAIAKASTPILLVHGMNDLRTPPSNSEALARANPRNPLWLVPNAGHAAASVAAPEEFRKRVLAWFAEN
jgi:dipeptidyl aminopeptidase/acylaminoacyl peptidase